MHFSSLQLRHPACDAGHEADDGNDGDDDDGDEDGVMMAEAAACEGM